MEASYGIALYGQICYSTQISLSCPLSTNQRFILNNQQTIKHPVGMWYLASTFAVLSFGFGVVNSLLVLYLTQVLHFKPAAAYTLFAAFNSFLYILPLYSGRLSDWFGYRAAFIVGMVMEIVALYFLTVPNRYMLYLGLALFMPAAALCSPAFYVLIGKMYKKNDIRRESAFTLSYMLMNLSYLVAFIAGGYAEQFLSFKVSFLLAAGISSVALLMFLVARRFIVPDPSRDMRPRLSLNKHYLLIGLIITALIPFPIGFFLLREATFGNWLVLIVGGALIPGVLLLAFKQKEKAARYKLIAFALLSLVSIGFWSLYMLEPSMLAIFVRDNVNRVVLGYVIPPSVYNSLDPFFVVVLGWMFSRLWLYLRARKRDISLPAKFTSSVLVMGVGFLLLVPAILMAGGGKVNSLWMILVYLLLTVGELLISPIGLAMVGRLAPEGMEGLLMGVWQVFTGLSAAVSAYLAKLAIVPQHGATEVTNPVYAHAFLKIGLFSLILGAFSWLLLPHIKRIMKTK
jgi:proton-dependent oligopeptide transporter, POT family